VKFYKESDLVLKEQSKNGYIAVVDMELLGSLKDWEFCDLLKGFSRTLLHVDIVTVVSYGYIIHELKSSFCIELNARLEYSSYIREYSVLFVTYTCPLQRNTTGDF
jgi:hypothetical protein